MNAKEINQDKLIAFLQKQWEQHQQLENYYERQLAELKHQPLPPPIVSPSKPSPNRPKHARVKTEEAFSMEESVVSISQATAKGEKKQIKREELSFEMEYQLLSKEIAKLIDTVSNKDVVFKKSTVVTPKRNSSFTNKTTLKPAPVVPQFKMNLSTVSVSKTERQQTKTTERERLLCELGDTTMIVSNDEVVSKLVGNLRLEEQRFVDGLLARSKMSAKSKMRNYLQHLCEKNEETLFKLRQQTIDRSLSRMEVNRETVRNGYTRKMKGLVNSNHSILI